MERVPRFLAASCRAGKAGASPDPTSAGAARLSPSAFWTPCPTRSDHRRKNRRRTVPIALRFSSTGWISPECGSWAPRQSAVRCWPSAQRDLPRPWTIRRLAHSEWGCRSQRHSVLRGGPDARQDADKAEWKAPNAGPPTGPRFACQRPDPHRVWLSCRDKDVTHAQSLLRSSDSITCEMICAFYHRPNCLLPQLHCLQPVGAWP